MGGQFTQAGFEQKQNRLAHEEKTESKRQKSLERELEWVRMSPRRSSGEEQSPCECVRGDVKTKAKAQNVTTDMEIFIPPGPRLGGVVLEVAHMKKSVRRQIIIRRHEL